MVVVVADGLLVVADGLLVVPDGLLVVLEGGRALVLGVPGARQSLGAEIVLASLARFP